MFYTTFMTLKYHCKTMLNIGFVANLNVKLNTYLGVISGYMLRCKNLNVKKSRTSIFQLWTEYLL